MWNFWRNERGGALDIRGEWGGRLSQTSLTTFLFLMILMNCIPIDDGDKYADDNDN